MDNFNKNVYRMLQQMMYVRDISLSKAFTIFDKEFSPMEILFLYRAASVLQKDRS